MYLKLLHNIWSGTTKYIRQQCQIWHKPVEFPGLGIFMPSVLRPEKARLTANSLERIEDSSEIIMIVNEQFLMDNGLSIGNKNDIMISSETAEQSPEYGQQTQNLQRINFASIAQVCNTDAATVENALKEVLAQIGSHVKSGAILRVNFRVGRVEFKNGEVNWK